MVNQEEMDNAVAEVLQSLHDPDGNGWLEESVADNLDLVAKFYGDSAVKAKSPERVAEFEFKEMGISRLRNYLVAERKSEVRREARRVAKEAEEGKDVQMRMSLA